MLGNMHSGAINRPEDELDSTSGRDLAPLLKQHGTRFLATFGPGEAPRLFFSPGRVSLIGAHLDYNGGPVMPTAVDRGTFFAVRPTDDGRVRFASTLNESRFEFTLTGLPREPLGRWVDYPLGVLLGLVDHAHANRTGDRLAGFEVLFGGNLPVGAGLSSSASICVGSALVFDQLWGLGLNTLERVGCALRAEREFVGVRCGIMDPYAVGFARPGHLLWLDCKDASWEHVPIDFSRISIGVADSGVRRELAQGAFNRRVEQCALAFDVLRVHAPGAECLRDIPRAVLDSHGASLPPEVAKRARHVIDEVERAFAARQSLLAGDVVAVGQSMTASHMSLRDQYEVSCPELDVLVEATIDGPGGLGARLTGAGFGGCAVLLVERGAEDVVRERVAARFAERFERHPRIEFFGGDEGPREIT